jgi:general secretion pathway protein D
MVQGALGQLDSIPLQVLLEAVIAEVTLTDQLQYGVQSFFKSGKASGLLSTVPNSSLALTPGGFSFVFQNNSVSALLELLAQVTTVQVVSSPEVMVVNNHTASLQVGDDVPIATASAVSTVTSSPSIVNSIQMESTGVILKVTPRVNPGGLVLMDVSQDVSASVNTTTSSIDSPTIQQRRIATTVAVQDGQTIALGGLISDNRSRSRTGFPWLMDLPVVGPLFGLTNDNSTRTELLVLITPHVVRDRQSAERVTEELRSKLSSMHVFDPKPVPADGSPR